MEVGGGNGSDKEDRGPAKGQARRRPPADGVPEDCCWRNGIGSNERRQGMKINLAYQTKIAEWELGAGIGVEEVWRRLNNTLLKKAQAQVEAMVKKARHARKSRKK